MIDTKLLAVLACPVCKGDVEYNAKKENLTCIECGKEYDVIDGIPIMLVEDPKTLM